MSCAHACCIGTPPTQYLVAVEAGLRMTSKDKQAMGTFAYSSKEKYHSVDLWRKREAYIGVSRLILGCPNYLKYVSYRWSDYVMRNRLTKTFLARHWKLTNGESNLLDTHFADDFGGHTHTSYKGPAQPASKVIKGKTKEIQSTWYYDSDEDQWKERE